MKGRLDAGRKTGQEFFFPIYWIIIVRAVFTSRAALGTKSEFVPIKESFILVNYPHDFLFEQS